MPTTTTLSISITPATEPDIPTLAHIAAVAMSPETLHQILFPSNNLLDLSRPEQFIAAELRRAAQNPDAHILKATTQNAASSSGETVTVTVGYAMFRFAEGAPSGPAKASFPEGTNVELLKRMGTAIRAAHEKHVGAKRHVWWSSLMVLPAYQKQGIGSALFRHGFEKLGANELPVWLVT